MKPTVELTFTNIALLQGASKMFDLRVSVFCLMSDYYHLLVQTPSGTRSTVAANWWPFSRERAMSLIANGSKV